MRILSGLFVLKMYTTKEFVQSILFHQITCISVYKCKNNISIVRGTVKSVLEHFNLNNISVFKMNIKQFIFPTPNPHREYL